MKVALNIITEKMKLLTATKITAMLIGLSMFLGGCEKKDTVVPSTNVTTQERFVQDYTGIEVSTAFDVDVTYSATEESIIIEANENLHEFIEVEKVNNILRIKIRDNINISGSATLRAHVITKNYLSSFYAAEASHITLINPQELPDITVRLSSASLFSGAIIANSITAFIEEASNADFQGSADRFTLNAYGASLIGTYDMIIENADIHLAFASSASLTINGTIDLTASEGSLLLYKGTAQENNINLSEGSQIIKVN